MKCHKCSFNLTEEDDFCPECGFKVTREEVHNSALELHKKKRLKLSKRTILISSLVIGIVVFVSIIVIAVPFPYQAIQQYIEKVPYIEQENYTKSVPFQSNECHQENVKYIVVNATYMFDEWVGYFSDDLAMRVSFPFSQWLHINIQNVDDTEGKFNAECSDSKGNKYITDSNFIQGNGTYITSGVWIGPGEISYLYCSFQFNKYDTIAINYVIIPPEKQVCTNITRYDYITNTINITKYKDEYKERNITKTSTLYRMLTGTTDWYFEAGEE